MRFPRRLVTVLAVPVLLAVPALSAQASARPPVYLTAGQHACTATNPEYLVASGGMAVTVHPGTTLITARYTGGGRWQSAYEATGALDELASICDSREIPGSGGLYGQALTLGFRVGRHVRVTADLHASGSGRLGWDLWFVADRSEVTPTGMERDPRTYEVMVEPGHGRVLRDNPGWHRVYLAVLPERGATVNARGVSLTRLAAMAGVPGWLFWQAVDAGAETLRGSFTVYSQAVHVAGEHPEMLPHWQAPSGSLVVKA